MILYLCEKPSQGRDIGRVLGVTARREGYLQGADILVTWCVGHLLEMIAPDGYKQEWKSWRLDTLPLIPERWKLEVRKEVAKQYAVIRSLLKDVDEVVLATDADREGETIGREVLDRCRYRGKISRLWLSALDDASINKALANMLPGESTQPLYQAGMGRARADWLVGMNLTRTYTILGRQWGYDGVLSVGRVQTPTLKLVVDRDRQIENFQAVDFFDLLVVLQVESGRFVGKWLPKKSLTDADGRCLDKNIATAVMDKITGKSGVISKAETKPMSEPPPLPLELSTLQQEVSRLVGMGAKRGLEVAQNLYEKHKAITYPRSDCRYLPKSQLADVAPVMAALSGADQSIIPLIQGADLSLRSKAWNDKKITAHHAIIPTAARINIQAMSNDELLVYDLIRRHYIAQFYPPYLFERTTVDTVVEEELFRSMGRVEKQLGWKEVVAFQKQQSGEKSKDKQRNEQNLPPVRKGDAALVEKAKIEEKKTKPPPRFAEGTLIAAMKNVGRLVEDKRLRKILRDTAGIGTEATRASIIETLLQRKLLVKEGKKNIVSQPASRALVDMLPHSVTDPATTAVWEQALEDVANGQGTLEGFLQKAVIWIDRLVGNVKERERLGMRQFPGFKDDAYMQSPLADGESAKIKCPNCGRVMSNRNGKNGRFLGCSGYPNCKTTMADTAVEDSAITNASIVAKGAKAAKGSVKAKRKPRVTKNKNHV